MGRMSPVVSAGGGTTFITQSAEDFKDACQLATTANLAATYNNGASGVGATLTATSNGALSVDGVTVTVGQRILVRSQTTGLQNGIYDVTQVGTASTPFILTRSDDFDSSAEVTQGAQTYVVGGNSLAGRTYYVTTSGTITIGTTAITFIYTGGGVVYAVPQIGGLLIAHSTSSAEAQAAAYRVATGASFVADTQAAIDQIDGSAASGGDVLLAPMVMSGVAAGATGVKMKTAVNVRGAGTHSLGTQLLMGGTGGAAALFSLNDGDVHACYIGDFFADGGGDGSNDGALISFDNTGGAWTTAPATTPDTRIIIANIFARNYQGTNRDCIFVSSEGRVYLIADSYVIDAGRYGYNLGCVDSHVRDLHSLNCGVANYNIDSNNTRYVGCKSSFSEALGWSITSSGQRNMFIVCEAQDDATHGFQVAGRDNVLDVLVDCNGRTGTGYGVNITASRNTVKAKAMNFRDPSGTQDGIIQCSSNYNRIEAHGSQHPHAGTTGVRLTGTAHHNRITLMLEDFINGLDVSALTSAQVNFVEGVIANTTNPIVDSVPTKFNTGSWARISHGASSLFSVG